MIPSRLWALVLVLCCCGCPTQPMFATPAHPSPETTTMAGVARVDITPPPGLSLWGHGPESRVATGRMTRLWCQVFVIVGAASGQQADGVALVTCDMAWSSLVVQRQIARRVAELSKRGEPVPLGADRIWVMATHTHAGMGHLWPWANYTGPFSARLRGFDLDAVNFVAERVGDKIVEAYRQRFPARLAWGKAPVYGIGYNRSLSAFDHNGSWPASLPRHTTDPETQRTLAPAEQATDPQLSVLRIDRVTGEQASTPAGVLAIYGVHPAVIANDNTLYHGDLFGFAVDRAQRDLGGADAVVVGIGNGIEGDVAPQKHLAAPRESRRLGEALAARIVELHHDLDAAVRDAGDAVAVTAGYRDLYLPGAYTRGGPLCETPALGASAGGGAEDNPTKLRVIMHNNPGVRRRVAEPHPCHGAKLDVQAPLTPFVAGTHFPAYVPIAVARIGDGILATLPAEVTTVAGLRIRDVLQRELRLDDDQVVAIAGLTGAYIQYVATEDEYPMQLYEGASTLYGPNSAEFFVDQMRCLASHSLGDRSHPCRGPLAKSCPGPSDELPRGHGPIDCPFPILYPSSEQELLICRGGEEDRAEVRCGAEDATRVCPAAPCDGRPIETVVTEDGELAFQLSFVADPLDQRGVRNRGLVSARVERLAAGRWIPVDDDRGTRISVRTAIDADDKWAVAWRPPVPTRHLTTDDREPHWRAQVPCGETYRLVVRGRSAGDELTTAPFRLHCDLDLSPVNTIEGRAVAIDPEPPQQQGAP